MLAKAIVCVDRRWEGHRRGIAAVQLQRYFRRVLRRLSERRGNSKFVGGIEYFDTFVNGEMTPTDDAVEGLMGGKGIRYRVRRPELRRAVSSPAFRSDRSAAQRRGSIDSVGGFEMFKQWWSGSNDRLCSAESNSLCN